jgi:hypothetical protein
MIVDNCPAHPHVKGLKSMKLVPEEYTAVDDNLVTSAKMTNDDIVEDIISSRQHNNVSHFFVNLM